MELTADLERAFEFAGCTPMCHACGEPIKAGSVFQLISFEGMDEMLCGLCDRAKLRRAKERTLQASAGGYSRPSQRKVFS